MDSARVAGIGSRVWLGLVDSAFPPVIGVLANLGPDSIIVVSGRRDRVTLARSNVRTVQISIERKPAYARGAAIGAAVGALTGGRAILFYSSVVPKCDDLPPSQSLFEWRAYFDASPSRIASEIGITSAIGAVIGLVKAANSPRPLGGRTTETRWALLQGSSPSALAGCRRAGRAPGPESWGSATFLNGQSPGEKPATDGRHGKVWLRFYSLRRELLASFKL